eukprot:g27543.t1
MNELALLFNCSEKFAMSPLMVLSYAQDTKSGFPEGQRKESDGPDRVPGRALRSCADQLAEVFSDIFNLSLLQVKVPTCFKKTTIISIPKKTHAMCINDDRPVALVSIIMKCFERLAMAHINSSLPACLDPLQFAYQQNRSKVDISSLALHSSLEHLENRDTY